MEYPMTSNHWLFQCDHSAPPNSDDLQPVLYLFVVFIFYYRLHRKPGIHGWKPVGPRPGNSHGKEQNGLRPGPKDPWIPDECITTGGFNKHSFDYGIICPIFRNFDWIIFLYQITEYTIFGHSKNIFLFFPRKCGFLFFLPNTKRNNKKG